MTWTGGTLRQRQQRRHSKTKQQAPARSRSPCNAGQTLGGGNSTSTRAFQASPAIPDARRSRARHPPTTAKQSNQQEFADKQRPQRPLAHAEATHGRAAVQMPAREAVRGHRNSNRREQRGEQRDEREEMTGAVDGLSALAAGRPATIRAPTPRSLPSSTFIAGERGELLDLRIRSRHQQPIGHATAKRDRGRWTRVHRHASSGAGEKLDERRTRDRVRV